MTPTYSAQMPIKAFSQYRRKRRKSQPAFTLAESMVVIVIASLIVTITLVSFSAFFGNRPFRAQANELVSLMQMAVTAAAQTGKRYEVIIDISEQTYLLREITNADLIEVLEEEIIAENQFSDNCRAAYVLFDDLVETSQDYQKASFRAGRWGWQNSGKIVLLDPDEQPYTIIVNRINRVVRLYAGDVDLLWPKRPDEISF